MVVKLSHKVVVSRSNDLFLSHHSLSSTSSKILSSIAWDDLWDRWRVPMYFLLVRNMHVTATILRLKYFVYTSQVRVVVIIRNKNHKSAEIYFSMAGAE
jgi:hypothetical protein